VEHSTKEDDMMKTLDSWKALSRLPLLPLALCTACGMARSVGTAAPMVSVVAAPPPPSPAGAVQPDVSAEQYAKVPENPFFVAREQPVSTFSADVDTAGYSNVRRFLLGESRLPPHDAVRIEEMLNYFRYDYPAPPPTGDAPLAATLEVSDCPWAPSHQLVRIGLQAKQIDRDHMPPRNLVFLLDVSGSMEPANRLPMVKRGMRMLVDQLTDKDTVAIVTYAGASGLALPPTRGDQKGAILAALSRLEAGGGTNGAEGIQLAYQIATEHFQPGAINRVLLSTDGDFNVGVTSQAALVRLIEKERASGVYLSVLGVGEGNLHDATMEMLADKGNGNYAYLDRLSEARKVLVEQAGGTLVTVANDVKLQAEFDPAKVRSYRLVGYENRVMENRDFNDDTKDAGDMGAGHSVTALYEIDPAPAVAPPRVAHAAPLGAKSVALAARAEGAPLVTLRVRYKDPGQSESKLLSFPSGTPKPLAESSADFRFAAAVAAFGLVLKDSAYKGNATLPLADQLAASAAVTGAPDPGGYRAELRQMVNQAELLRGDSRPAPVAR
jgi:Ca-activated chloride channel family protein